MGWWGSGLVEWSVGTLVWLSGGWGLGLVGWMVGTLVGWVFCWDLSWLSAWWGPWLVVWLVGTLVGWDLGWLCGWLGPRLVVWLVGTLVGWVFWLGPRLVEWLVGTLVGWVFWLGPWLVECFVGNLVACVAGWDLGWLSGWGQILARITFQAVHVNTKICKIHRNQKISGHIFIIFVKTRHTHHRCPQISGCPFRSVCMVCWWKACLGRSSEHVRFRVGGACPPWPCQPPNSRSHNYTTGPAHPSHALRTTLNTPNPPSHNYTTGPAHPSHALRTTLN